jgi:hypothetical protein
LMEQPHKLGVDRVFPRDACPSRTLQGGPYCSCGRGHSPHRRPGRASGPTPRRPDRPVADADARNPARACSAASGPGWRLRRLPPPTPRTRWRPAARARAGPDRIQSRPARRRLGQPPTLLLHGGGARTNSARAAARCASGSRPWCLRDWRSGPPSIPRSRSLPLESTRCS